MPVPLALASKPGIRNPENFSLRTKAEETDTDRAMVLPFKQRVKDLPVARTALKTLQVNVGKLCNQACHHCHVEAGPKRTEIMSVKTANRVLELLRETPGVETVDVTGGAPELCPSFRPIVQEARRLGLTVIDRCNLTVLYEKGQEDTADFLAANRVKVVASLPCYSKENVDKQRGRGVFDKSIRGLQLLNRLGYATPGSGLELDLVYNPLGDFLPPEEKGLEATYKRELSELFGIEFNRLYSITNMPIKRFLEDLLRNHKLDHYMTVLANAFNPRAAEGIMCRSLVSVGWDGQLYDCDFNQMLDIPLAGAKSTIWDRESFANLSTSIEFGDHCYGCTAGAGSSCGGSIT